MVHMHTKKEKVSNYKKAAFEEQIVKWLLKDI